MDIFTIGSKELISDEMWFDECTHSSLLPYCYSLRKEGLIVGIAFDIVLYFRLIDMFK